ncbi:MAG: ABC transporter permease [Candidatus Acidiferrales bacterium]
MESLVQDIKYAVRTLLKSPGFTVIAVLTLALGIGANTALFSVVNGVLLKPLPYAQPEQLVALAETSPSFETSSISYPNFLDWQRSNSVFSAIAADRSDDFVMTGNGEAERVRIAMVSASFFQILGIHTIRGRLFTQNEDRLGTTPVALISSGLWQRKFGSAPDIVGKTITMNGDGYTIMGVIPSSFYLQSSNFDSIHDVYIPIGQYKDPLFQDRKVHEGTRAIGRLKPGVTLAAAQADMNQVASNLAATYPDADKNAGISIMPLKKDIVGNVEPFLLVLLGAVGFVLLIACVNVANLQLARSTTRAREFAIRSALGASQSRVVRQLLTESILLGLSGGVIGLCIAAWGTQAALGALPETLHRAQDVSLDGRVLGFTLAVSVFAGIIFGLAPALKTARPNLQETLRESGRGASGVRHRAQTVFIVLEMAMALVLLVGAGLMVRSLIDLWNVNPGFNSRGVLTFAASLSPSLGVNATTSKAAIRQMDETLKTVPGVESVASTGGSLPMSGDSELPFWLDGRVKPANVSEMSQSLFYFANPEYLKVMEIPLQRGRFFTEDDNEHALPVVVIDENFAREFFPNQEPIGKQVHIGIVNVDAQIIGVVGHVKHWGLDTDGDAKHPIVAQAYMPYMQIPDQFDSGPPAAEVVVRTKGSPTALAPAIRDAIEKLNSENVIYETKSLQGIVAESLADRRFSMVLLSIFAALALLLSSIGIYGVVSYVMGQRTHEIGIRMALGAQRMDVLRLMLGEGMKMALVGVAIGIAVALGLTHLMITMLFGVSATDPATFAGVATLLIAVALAACYIPARRAMRVDPIVALRYE